MDEPTKLTAEGKEAVLPELVKKHETSRVMRFGGRTFLLPFVADLATMESFVADVGPWGTDDELYSAWVMLNLPRAQIKGIMELARNVFEDQEIAKKWLNEPNLATDNKPPIALLGTDDGLLRVQTLLHRIEYGVLA